MPAVQPSTGASPGRGRGRRTAPSLSEINVVPLVDVMLVLLIIFMVTAPMIQRGIDVTLPEASRASGLMSERLFVTIPVTYAEDHLVYLDDEQMRREVLSERVRQKMETAEHKQVYLRGDTGVRMGELMDVIDRLKAAGVVDVAIVTRKPGER
jgi:biopolymer transport protein TolR